MKTKEELNDEMLSSVSGGDLDDLVDRVIRGDYGNGEARKYRLRAAGYDYGRVQNEVNRRLGYSQRHLWDNPEDFDK